VLSPVLYYVYIDDLLLALSNSGVGCYIGNNFVGALDYADDNVLIARTAPAMRKAIPYAESMQLNIVFRSMPLNPSI